MAKVWFITGTSKGFGRIWAEAALARGDKAAGQQFNDAFHDALVSLAHNDLLAALLEPLQGRLHWLFRQNEDIAELIHEHRELYDAIASGNPDRAGRTALEHVQVNRRTAIRLLFGDNSPAVRAEA